MFNLRFSPHQIHEWAEKYPIESDIEVENLAPHIQEQGYYRKDELQIFCRWKTPRSQPRVARNPSDFIEATTQTALATPNERLRIEVLTLLRGVSWPTASVLLHFGHVDDYPILDFRALWSLGIEVPPTYDFDFWWAYTQFCRKLTNQATVSMRALDRALWQYSKENQI